MRYERKPSPQTRAVLAALAERAADWSHGYELSRTLGIKAGTLYPILIRLAERGLVDTAWEQDAPSGRPPRHLYRLSADGAEYVRELRRAQSPAGRSTVESAATVVPGVTVSRPARAEA
ncbi:MAG: PadR family transcriptional regulator [Streptosporangiales bacterium]|nr:PadR family transcriptional regulator [Streptosporangiales bacterium]